MRKPANPFILSGYHSPPYFCDRINEMDWLLDQFNNDRNVVLYSLRRMGKTALIRHFFHYLEKQNIGQCIFIDLLGTYSMSEANKRISEAVLDKYGSFDKGIGARFTKLLGVLGAKIGVDPVSGSPEITVGLQSAEEVPRSLEFIGRFLSERKAKVVICIDEFQQVVNYREPNAEATFRTWMQKFPMIRFVYSGSHRQMMLSMFSEESRPFYRSAQLKKLESIDPVEYRQFILDHFKERTRGLDDEMIKQVFDWTRLQTYYVQLICNKIHGKGGTIKHEIMVEVFREIIDQETPIFTSMQQLFTSFQWKLLRAIAMDENVANPMSSSFITRHHLGAASSVKTALTTLSGKEFIIRDNDSYTIQDTLFMRYIQSSELG